MKTTVVITPMNGQEATVKSFITERDAYNFFTQWCDEHGYEYESDSTEAGGRGHDYRIEITE